MLAIELFSGLFWVVLAGIAALTTCVAYETQTGAVVSFVALMVAVFFVSDFNIFSWVAGNANTLAIGFVAWVLLGVVWSIFKWYIFLRKEVELALEEKELCKKEYIAQGKDISKFENFWAEKVYKYHSKPKASDSKERITTWITWWPFSILHTILTTLFHDMIQEIFRILKGTYQRMSDKIFEGV